MMYEGISSFSEVDPAVVEQGQLNLHGNKLSSLVGLFEIPNLTELNLSSNNFRTSDLAELSLLPSLHILDLSGNQLTSLEHLPFLPMLSSFSVAFNFISSLKGIENFINIEILDCRGNRITALKECIFIQHLGNLSEMYLSSSDGRNSNPICERAVDILHLFDDAKYFGSIDGKDRQQWSLDVPVVSTPNFDRIVKQFASRNTISWTANESCAVPLQNLSAKPKNFQYTAGMGFAIYTIFRNTIKSKILKAWNRWATYVACHKIAHEMQLNLIHIVGQKTSVLEALLLEVNTKSNNFERQVSELNGDVESLKLELNNSAEQYSQATENLKSQISREKERADEFRAQLLRHSAQTSVQNNEVQRCRNLCTTLREELATKNSQLEEYKLLNEKEKRQYDEELSMINKSVEKKVSSEKIFVEKLRECQDNIESLALKLQHSTAFCSEKDKLIEDLHDSIKSIENLKREKDEKIEELDCAIVLLNMELSNEKKHSQSLQNEILNLKEEIVQSKICLRNVNIDFDKSKEAVIKLNAENLNLAKDLVTKDAALNEQQKNLSEICPIVDELKGALKKLHGQCKFLELQNSQSLKREDALKIQISDMEGRFLTEKHITSMKFDTDIKVLMEEKQKILVKLEESQLYIRDIQTTAKAEVESGNQSYLHQIENLSLALKVKDKVLFDQAAALKDIKGRYEARISAAESRVREMEDELNIKQDELSDMRVQLSSSLRAQQKMKTFIKSSGDSIEFDNTIFDNNIEKDQESNESELSSSFKIPLLPRYAVIGLNEASSRDTEDSMRRDIGALREALELKNKHLETAQSELHELAKYLESVRIQVARIQEERDSTRKLLDSTSVELERLRKLCELQQSQLLESETKKNELSHQFQSDRNRLEFELVNIKQTLLSKDSELNLAKENFQKLKDAFSSISNMS